jgi:hypothetical protein
VDVIDTVDLLTCSGGRRDCTGIGAASCEDDRVIRAGRAP